MNCEQKSHQLPIVYNRLPNLEQKCVSLSWVMRFFSQSPKMQFRQFLKICFLRNILMWTLSKSFHLFLKYSEDKLKLNDPLQRWFLFRLHQMKMEKKWLSIIFLNCFQRMRRNTDTPIPTHRHKYIQTNNHTHRQTDTQTHRHTHCSSKELPIRCLSRCRQFLDLTWAGFPS